MTSILDGYQIHPATYEPNAKIYTPADLPALRAQYPNATEAMLQALVTPARISRPLQQGLPNADQFALESDQRALLTDDNGQPFTSWYSSMGQREFDKGYDGKDLYFADLGSSFGDLLKAAGYIGIAMGGVGALSGALGAGTGGFAGAASGGATGAVGGGALAGGFAGGAAGGALGALGGGSLAGSLGGFLGGAGGGATGAIGGASGLAGSAGTSGGGLLSSVANSPLSSIGSGIKDFITGDGSLTSGGTGLLSTALGGLGSYLNGQSAQDAASTNADAQIRAAQIAADAAKFRPVGVSTRFGTSAFGYDANGNLTGAGYALTPDIKAQQDKLMGISNDALTQYQGAQAATAPMGQAAQTLFGLGNSYLSTTPQQQAAQYMSDQQALLASPRERELAALEAKLQARGRGGLSMGATADGMTAANPELEAFYNAQRQQDLGLAAAATQGGMDYAKFGAGLVGTGGDMLTGMYNTQSAAYQPYSTALGGATTLEGLGQNAMDLGINIGAKGTAANAASGQLLANGMSNAANIMQPSNSYSPWGGLLTGAGSALQNYQQQQQQQSWLNSLWSA